ncbi:MAG: 50S ribosomal protein L9 [Bacteroidales bacterium]|nr:50S ribosomal protein L9 [Clostridium sp.]MCM1204974.1 50S ribosomal protein L9 [Bacteroidales bacterium]
MEVILLEDVKNVGKKGDVVKVNDGYARNVLIKKKQALEATGKNLNDLKLKKANDDKIAAENLKEAQELGKKIEAAEITIAIKVGEGGKTFGSVSSKEIAEEVKAQLGFDVDKKKVQLKDGIKAVGAHEVKIKLHPKVTTTLKVNVVGK